MGLRRIEADLYVQIVDEMSSQEPGFSTQATARRTCSHGARETAVQACV